MATRRCPQCGLINPGSTTVCDCGWSFSEGTQGAPRNLSGKSAPRNLSERIDGERWRESRLSGTAQIAIGALLLVAGILITVVTSAPGSTHVVFAYGPIVFGMIYIVRGIIASRR